MKLNYFRLLCRVYLPFLFCKRPKGKANIEHGDLEIRILIKNSTKDANSPSTGNLRKVLEKLELSDSTTYWELKQKIWEFVGMSDPINLSKKTEKTIWERSIYNSAEIRILLEREGSKLFDLLMLPNNPDKNALDNAFLKKIIG